jgi:hypothetical protein
VNNRSASPSEVNPMLEPWLNTVSALVALGLFVTTVNLRRR